jgi:hypothetical protein
MLDYNQAYLKQRSKIDAMAIRYQHRIQTLCSPGLLAVLCDLWMKQQNRFFLRHTAGNTINTN